MTRRTIGTFKSSTFPHIYAKQSYFPAKELYIPLKILLKGHVEENTHDASKNRYLQKLDISAYLRKIALFSRQRAVYFLKNSVTEIFGGHVHAMQICHYVSDLICLI